MRFKPNVYGQSNNKIKGGSDTERKLEYTKLVKEGLMLDWNAS